LEPGSSAGTQGDAVVGDRPPRAAAGGAVPETEGAATAHVTEPVTQPAAEPVAAGSPRPKSRTKKEPVFEYPPGEEPRPREGEPTGWSHGELL
jgi:hypothetical protein